MAGLDKHIKPSPYRDSIPVPSSAWRITTEYGNPSTSSSSTRIRCRLTYWMSWVRPRTAPSKFNIIIFRLYWTLHCTLGWIRVIKRIVDVGPKTYSWYAGNNGRSICAALSELCEVIVSAWASQIVVPLHCRHGLCSSDYWHPARFLYDAIIDAM
jgi:hypothetical protein